jgi:hypothetical protein
MQVLRLCKTVQTGPIQLSQTGPAIVPQAQQLPHVPTDATVVPTGRTAVQTGPTWPRNS